MRSKHTSKMRADTKQELFDCPIVKGNLLVCFIEVRDSVCYLSDFII